MDLAELGGAEEAPHKRVALIAEAGVNHNGHPELALALVDAAAVAGADVVKFQAFVPERMVAHLAGKAAYQADPARPDEGQYAMLKRLQLPACALAALMERARLRGIAFLASVFDEQSAALLRDLGAAAFKIPSGELTNLPLIQTVAAYGKPLLVSTGMANLGEVEDAIQTVLAAGNSRIILMHCVSAYPAAHEHLNLMAMRTLREAFGFPVGYSDHTPGNEAALAAAALGASVIEKHFTLDQSMEGPDHRASITPSEFKQLVQSVRKVETALGDGRKGLTEQEAEIRLLVRKSIVAAVDIEEGTVVTPEMLTLKRPATGLAPRWLPCLAGRRAARSISRDSLLAWEDLR